MQSTTINAPIDPSTRLALASLQGTWPRSPRTPPGPSRRSSRTWPTRGTSTMPRSSMPMTSTP